MHCCLRAKFMNVSCATMVYKLQASRPAAMVLAGRVSSVMYRLYLHRQCGRCQAPKIHMTGRMPAAPNHRPLPGYGTPSRGVAM